VFDVAELVASCVGALDETEPRQVITGLVRRAVARSTEVAAALAPAEPGISLLHTSPQLTIINFVWRAGMALPPHDHRMWAVIGIYGGREANTLYRRTVDEPARIEQSGGRELDEGDVLVLGREAIHSVANPLARMTGAIHVYGGDFVHEPRSQWGPGDLQERPYDLAYFESLFC
jgi:predicted metal-dependent enzyme (double-stranded beta helix superfamily)